MDLKKQFARIQQTNAGDLARLIHQKFNKVRVAQVAGSLTYTTLLSLVPLVTVVVTVMSQFAQFANLSASMRVFLLDNLLPDKAGKVITTYALQFSEKASNLTIVGTIFLFVTAVMLLQTVEHTFNDIWCVRRRRAWWVRMPMYWLALTLGPLLFAASIATTTQLISASLGAVNSPAWLQATLLRVSPVLLLSAFFAYIFHAVPNRRLVLWHSFAGGLLAGVGVMAVQRLFGLYLATLPSVTLIYGAFSVVPIFLIWLYFSWAVVLLGAILASVLPEFCERGDHLPDTSAGRIHASLRMAALLAQSQKDGRAMPLAEISRWCGLSQPNTEKMFNEMLKAGWVVRTEADEWVLCVAAGSLRLKDFVMRLAVGDYPSAPHAARRDQDVMDEVFRRINDALDTPITDLLSEKREIVVADMTCKKDPFTED